MNGEELKKRATCRIKLKEIQMINEHEGLYVDEICKSIESKINDLVCAYEFENIDYAAKCELSALALSLCLGDFIRKNYEKDNHEEVLVACVENCKTIIGD